MFIVGLCSVDDISSKLTSVHFVMMVIVVAVQVSHNPILFDRAHVCFAMGCARSISSLIY